MNKYNILFPNFRVLTTIATNSRNLLSIISYNEQQNAFQVANPTLRSRHRKKQPLKYSQSAFLQHVLL